MHTKLNPFNFDSSYLSLPNKFFSLVYPTPVSKPELVLLNQNLLEALDINEKDKENLVSWLSGNADYANIQTFAQAYAGHQFGHFTMLGDGRAVFLGEHLTKDLERFDIQLKGAGKTPYSRNGDGRATIKAMLREYLISEAMHNLNIPTSRSLAVIKTGDFVYREKINEGGVLTRVMKSHLRVGTFEYARNYGSIEELKILTKYTIKRHFPEIEKQKNYALGLLEKVMQLQINLVVNWMRVGFIHGVMNTDNTSICGETFDYGPCAFINNYDPATVYSSIDANSRYAFGNQPNVIKWNMIRLAEALLPLIDEQQEKAIELAQNTINSFDVLWNEKYHKMMLNKIGIEKELPQDFILISELVEIMNQKQLDYTNTFTALLSQIDIVKTPLALPNELTLWVKKWKERIGDNKSEIENSCNLMKANNPVFIPRNHLVEEVLEKATQGDLKQIEAFLEVLKNPYLYKQEFNGYLSEPTDDFDKNHKTFCGT